MEPPAIDTLMSQLSSISESDGTFVETLTIPVIPVYNGIQVVCRATFDDGSPERTPSVTLIITGWLQQKYYTRYNGSEYMYTMYTYKSPIKAF